MKCTGNSWCSRETRTKPYESMETRGAHPRIHIPATEKNTSILGVSPAKSVRTSKAHGGQHVQLHARNSIEMSLRGYIERSHESPTKSP